jgi:rare lipoprotein A
MCDGLAGLDLARTRELCRSVGVVAPGGRMTLNGDAMRALIAVVFSFAFFSPAEAENGLASYYGYGKAGKSGEMTCAHRTRPFGSVLTVSYSGRSIQCRVNDRGPFIRGRIIDLSVSAARALGMMSAGVVHVSVQ